MLISLLLSFLFFGLISMILPSDRRTEWIYLLLISVLIISIGSNLVQMDFSLPRAEEYVPENNVMLPESAALHSAVSSQVLALTGEKPLSVECDLQRQEDSYDLTWIRVVIKTGNEKEVQDALQTAFSFKGFTVVCEQGHGYGDDLDLSP